MVLLVFQGLHAAWWWWCMATAHYRRTDGDGSDGGSVVARGVAGRPLRNALHDCHEQVVWSCNQPVKQF
jgi:hypothetical protein